MKSQYNYLSENNAMQKALEICLEQNVKFTKLRQNILQLIWENDSPIKAYDILKILKVNFPSSKPITIYRTLDFLMENKLIHRLETQNAFMPCNHPKSSEDHHCYFIICVKCHQVSEGCKDDLLTIVFDQLGKKNFRPSKVVLEIQGFCSNCW